MSVAGTTGRIPQRRKRHLQVEPGPASTVAGAPATTRGTNVAMARRRPSAPRQFSRTDRVGEVIQRSSRPSRAIGDERLEMVTITAVDVDGALERADVFYSCLSADEEGRSDEVAEALEERRWKVQQVINRQVQTRRTPQISFRPDTVLSSALRIEQILRDIGVQEEPDADGEPGGGQRGWPADRRRGRRSDMTRRGPDTGPSGICVVDKPAGWTSHDVVAVPAGSWAPARWVTQARSIRWPRACWCSASATAPAADLHHRVPKTYEATIRFAWRRRRWTRTAR